MLAILAWHCGTWMLSDAGKKARPHEGHGVEGGGMYVEGADENLRPNPHRRRERYDVAMCVCDGLESGEVGFASNKSLEKFEVDRLNRPYLKRGQADRP